MKNRIAILLAALCLCAALFTGCADKTATPEKEAVLNSYEKYDDLLSVRAIDNTMHGSIELSDDPDYVTDGEKSAKFTFNRDYGNYSDTAVGLYSEAESFSFVSSFLPEKFRFIDRYEYVSLDVYSAAEQVMTLYLNVIDADGNCLDGNCTRLASKGWTHVRFDLKPWFYEKDTTFGELRFYVRGWQDITADKVVMYFDNMRVGFTDNTLPERNKPADVSRNGIELQNKRRVRIVFPLCAIMRRTPSKRCRLGFWARDGLEGRYRGGKDCENRNCRQDGSCQRAQSRGALAVLRIRAGTIYRILPLRKNCRQ